MPCVHGGELSQSTLSGRRKSAENKRFANDEREPDILLFLGHFLA